MTEFDSIWVRYLRATAERGPRERLARALEHAPRGGRALELGCGAGGDTLGLLRHGLNVLAVDALEQAVAHTRARVEAAGFASRFEGRTVRFEDLALAPESFDLISAGFSLPFVAPQRFEGFWDDLRKALKPAGILTGELFGDRDQWVGEPDHPARVFLDAAAVESSFIGYERLELEEREGLAGMATGGEKYWHVHSFVLRRSG